MDINNIIQDIGSGDIVRIRTAACEIIKHSQERDKILPLLPHRQFIADKTHGIEMGGALAPNRRFVDYTLHIIDFYLSEKGCPCELYWQSAYECNNPNTEEEKGNITIKETILVDKSWVDYYICTCKKCNQALKVIERDGHYTWWHWQKI